MRRGPTAGLGGCSTSPGGRTSTGGARARQVRILGRVAELLRVRRPARRRGRQLDALVSFAGCDPVTKEAWLCVGQAPQARFSFRARGARNGEPAGRGGASSVRRQRAASGRGRGWVGREPTRDSRVAAAVGGRRAARPLPASLARAARIAAWWLRRRSAITNTMVYAIPTGGPPTGTAVAHAQPLCHLVSELGPRLMHSRRGGGGGAHGRGSDGTTGAGRRGLCWVVFD